MAEDGLLHTTELLKTALPYVDVRSRLILDLLVKLYELIACLRNFRTKDMAACGFENTYEKVDTETLLKKIRPNCNQKERAFVDRILNIFQAKRIFEMYNTYMEAMKAMEGFDGFSGDNNDFNADNANDNTGDFMNSFSDFDLTSIIGDDNSEFGLNDSNIDNDTKSNGYDVTDIKEENPDNGKAAGDNSNLIESLKAMIPPEQMETFENLRMLFETMSYDDNKKSESEKE